ncbi:MAG: flagellar basal-body rod modification protein FlgD [Baekduia sp.]|jgi:flagellar basal-body rod modification protein FlgD|nr:flagellar basal-body rod modification protein FlgD [Baekduia sp.]
MQTSADMSITAAAATTTQATTATAPTNNSSKAQLDKNGFLKLLTEQMRNQDPSSSQDPSQYFQTIAQMTTVEQLTNLATASATQLAQQKVSAAENLLGRTVTYSGTDGLPVSGLVDGVTLTGANGPTLSVGGVAGIDPSSLTTVK